MWYPKQLINYRIDHCLDRDEICDIIFYNSEIRKGKMKLTQKNVHELVQIELYANGRSQKDDLGYYRDQCINAGELIEINDQIIEFVYKKYKIK